MNDDVKQTTRGSTDLSAQEASKKSDTPISKEENKQLFTELFVCRVTMFMYLTPKPTPP